MAHRLLIAGLAILLAGCSTKITAQQAVAMTDAALCDSIARYWVSRENGFSREFPVEAFYELVRRHPDWQARVPSDVQVAYPAMGTTTAEVACLWPRPYDVSRTILRDGMIEERWAYGSGPRGGARPPFLFFENGRLVRVRD